VLLTAEKGDRQLGGYGFQFFPEIERQRKIPGTFVLAPLRCPIFALNIQFPDKFDLFKKTSFTSSGGGFYRLKELCKNASKRAFFRVIKI
jgi:hypothetical protein